MIWLIIIDDDMIDYDGSYICICYIISSYEILRF